MDRSQPGKGDCIQYYLQGLVDGQNQTALVYFGGDVMLRNFKGVFHIEFYLPVTCHA